MRIIVAFVVTLLLTVAPARATIGEITDCWGWDLVMQLSQEKYPVEYLEGEDLERVLDAMEALDGTRPEGVLVISIVTLPDRYGVVISTDDGCNHVVYVPL